MHATGDQFNPPEPVAEHMNAEERELWKAAAVRQGIVAADRTVLAYRQRIGKKVQEVET